MPYSLVTQLHGNLLLITWVFVVRNDSNMIKSAVTAQQERDAVVKTRLALDALPKTFLRTDFDMGNPQTFASVLNIYNSTDGHRLV